MTNEIKEGVASISHGKDSMAMLEAIKILGLPLTRIVTVDIWATDTIRGELPPMVEFKEKADAFILERYGIEVEHIRADYPNDTFEHGFYQKYKPETIEKRRAEHPERVCTEIYGFPYVKAGAWCKRMKTNAVAKIKRSIGEGAYNYLGIAADEAERIKMHQGKGTNRLPLVEIGWTEADCYKWCEENGVLSPTYKDSHRDGCWFCPCQNVNSLRMLRRNYHQLWEMLLKWQADSLIPFKMEHDIYDYEKRFALEDEGLIDPREPFRWADIEHPQMRIDWSDYAK